MGVVFQAEWNTSLQHVWSVENAEFYYGCSEPTANFASKWDKLAMNWLELVEYFSDDLNISLVATPMIYK